MAYILLFAILFSAYPFVFPQFLPIPSVRELAPLFFLLLIILLLHKRKLLPFLNGFNYVFFFQIFIWLSYFLLHSDSSYFTRVILMLVAYMGLLYAHNNAGGILLFVKSFNYLILLMAIAGTVCFFLVLFEVITPLIEFSNVDGRSAYCFGLTCSNVYMGNIIRYAGYFDEPGAMANWGMFALLFNKLFIKDSRFGKILIVCLLFTFSIAYYIQLVCYIFLFSKNRVKRACQLLLFGLLIVIGIYQMKDTPYDRIYQMTIKRFEFDETTGSISGDNRTNLAELAKEQFLKAPIFGVGAQKFGEIGYMADNPYEILAKDGIVGEIITYLPLLLVLWYGWKKRPEYTVAVMILFLGYLQRPFHVDFIHPIVLYLFTIHAIQDLQIKFKYESYSFNRNCLI